MYLDAIVLGIGKYDTGKPGEIEREMPSDLRSLLVFFNVSLHDFSSSTRGIACMEFA